MNVLSLILYMGLLLINGSPKEMHDTGSSIVPIDTAKISLIDGKVESFFKKNNLPGISYGIIYQDDSVHMNSYGVQQIKTNQAPVSSNTIFYLASQAKPFTAFATVLLNQNGKVNLSDKVSDLLPYLKYSSPEFKEITLYNLLTHTSGIPDVESYGWKNPKFDSDAMENYLRNLDPIELRSAPGTEFYYSNLAYNILGVIVANVSGMTFEEYVDQNIFTPLNMNKSTFLFSEVTKNKLAMPYKIGSDGEQKPVEYYPYNREHAPSSNLFSTTLEMLNWLKMNMQQGVWEGKTILQKDAFKEMVSKQFIKPLPDGSPIVSYQGLGWSGLVIDDINILGHGGHDPGYRSVTLYSIEHGVAIVIMTNGDNEGVNVDGLGLELFGDLLNKDWSHFN